MNIETLRDTFPDYAKDIKLNLSTVLTEAGSPGLSMRQIFGTALASAYACREKTLIEALSSDSKSTLNDADLIGIQAAVSIMAMNNVYYRSMHLMSDHSFLKMPARLRMNVISNPGISKEDFEIYSLAVSAVNGCGMCLDAHAQTLQKEHIGAEGIQSTIRIASVIHAAAQVVFMLEQ